MTSRKQLLQTNHIGIRIDKNKENKTKKGKQIPIEFRKC